MINEHITLGLLPVLFSSDNVAIKMLQYGVCYQNADFYKSVFEKALYYSFLTNNNNARRANIKEMAVLNQKLKNNNINYAFIKGTILYSEFYKNTLFDRMEGDIDILVDPKDLCAVLESIGELGYYHIQESETVSPENVFSYFLESAPHLDTFYNGISRTKIEVHTSPIAISMSDSQKKAEETSQRELLSNISYVSLGGFEAPTLGINEMLFIILDHFARHILFDIYMCPDVSGVKIKFVFKSLFDCQCILKKYKNDINWFRIEKLSKEFENQNNIIFSLNALLEFWPELERLIEMNKFSINKSTDSLLQKLSMRLLKENINSLYQNNNVVYNFPKKIYWDIQSEPMSLARKIPSLTNDQCYQEKLFLYDNHYTPFRKYSFAQVDILNNMRLPPSAHLYAQWINDEITIHLSYYLTEVQSANFICVDLDFIDANSITKDKYTNYGSLSICFTNKYDIIMIVPNKDVIDKDAIITFTYECQVNSETCNILFHIDPRSLPIFGKGLDCINEKLYYNISLQHVDLRSSCYIKILSLWHNTIESDKTTMNSLLRQVIDTN